MPRGGRCSAEHAVATPFSITFVVRSVRYPSGGVLTNYELANALARRGHTVWLAHVPNMVMAGMARSLDQLGWFDFEPAVRHQFARGVAELAPVDFVVGFPTSRGEPPGLPLLLVQGHALGPEQQRRRMHAPCPKVCVSRWLVQFGIDAGVPEHELVYVPNGIRHERFRVTRPIEERDAVVAMMSHENPTKGTRVGLDALSDVLATHPRARAIVFGATPTELTLPDRATYVENPPQRALVDDVYNAASVFVQPSFHEGFGLTAVEAMACGCALVTTDNGGSGEYAIDGATALVAAPGDSGAIAAHVRSLFDDDAARIGLARRGREHVERFDWDRSAEVLERFLLDYRARPDRYRRAP